MDLFDVVRSCVRRWYIILPLLLIAAWYSYSIYSAVKPVYYSSAVIGIAPPSTRVDNAPAGTPLPRNGLLDVGGASLIANMAAVGLREPAVVDRVVAAGGVANYEAKMFPVPVTSAPLPLIMIDVTAPDPTTATNTLTAVIAQSDPTLRALQQQARVPDDQMVAPFVVTPPSTPAAATPSRTRSTIAVFVACAGFAVLAAVLADVVLTRRKAKRPQASGDAGPVPTPVDRPTDVEQPIPPAAQGALEPR